MKNYLRDRPWIWIWVGFFVLIGAWSALFTIAIKNQPEKVPPATATAPRPS